MLNPYKNMLPNDVLTHPLHPNDVMSLPYDVVLLPIIYTLMIPCISTNITLIPQ